MMKKTLLLSALALGLISSTANAFTAQEIAAKGKVWKAIYENDVYITVNRNTYQYTTNIPYLTEGDISLTVENGNLVIADGMNEMATVPMRLSISGTTATLQSSVFNLKIGTGTSERRNNITGQICVYNTFTPLVNDNGTFYGFIIRDRAQPRTQNESPAPITGKVTYDSATDSYTINFGKLEFVALQQVTGYQHIYYDTANNGTAGSYVGYANNTSSYYAKVGSSHLCQGMMFTTYSPNATVTDTEYAYNNRGVKSNATPRSYTANVQFSDNTVSIENWSNMGHATPPYLDNQWIFHTRDENFVGSFDKNNLTVAMPPMDVMTGTMTAYSNGDFTLNVVNMGAADEYDLNNVRFSEINGVIYTNDGLKHVGASKWLDGKKYLTYINKPQIQFEDYIFNETDEDDNCTLFGYVEGTEIAVNDDLEYTHALGIKKNAFGYGRIDDHANAKPDDRKYIFLNVNFENFKNSLYVDKYELYIMPEVTTPNYEHSDFGDENGHINGTRIDLPQYISEFAPKTKAVSEDESEDPFANNVYNLLIPEDDLIAKDNSGNGKYQLYAKAIYTKESGLEPSFHALTSLGDTTTGVESIIDNGENLDDAPVYFYNMNGVLVDGENLTPGLYIRRQGATSTKVLIK